jgi:hypothetical protein
MVYGNAEYSIFLALMYPFFTFRMPLRDFTRLTGKNENSAFKYLLLSAEIYSDCARNSLE